MMTPAELQAVPPHFVKYVDRAKSMEWMDALKTSSINMQELLRTVPEEKGTYRYAEGKWSVKEVLNHMMDAERVFLYRALRFARNDKTELHGFDENTYAPEANAHARTIKQLAEEMVRLRASTIDFFASLTPEMLERKGKSNGAEVQVKALAYITAGHELHHLVLFKERYFQ